MTLVKSRTISGRAASLRAGLTLFAALALAACADEEKPLNTFEPEGPRAEMIDDLMRPIWWIAGVIGVLVVGGGIVLAIRNRVKPEDYDPEDLPEQVHGNPTLEWGWTAAPAVLLAGISVFTVLAIWDLEEANDPGGYLDGEGELDVMVIGQQWWWEYRYDIDGDGFFEDVDGDGFPNSTDEWDPDDAEWPLEIALDDDDISVANELVIPAGQQIDLTITSRDVIHSFWIPRLNGKRDAVPGRLHSWNFTAEEPGEYTGWCTEYCGLSHARMRMNTIALPPDEFDEWIANQATTADIPAAGSEAAAGRELFQQQCASCHIVWEEGIGQDPLYTGERNEGDADRQGRDFEAPLTAKAAPNLTHFATRSVMAGAIYSTYVGLDANDNDLNEGQENAQYLDDYLDLPSFIDESDDELDELRWNRAQLKRWIKNAPSQKDMAPDDLRGMPAFPGLSDDDLDHLIAYLATLD
ncbi:MAG: cytochrome c oxidase subunit II [Acidimicrobiales bacterium]|nr:cytochrome c oxidase subunit II [Acidimicrobiales bacterium]